MPFTKGHTTNVGKVYRLAKAKRVLKRRSKEAEMLENLEAEDLLPGTAMSEENRLSATDRLLANRSAGKPFKKGHPQFGHRHKRTASIKDHLEIQLKKYNESVVIARRLINMAKAGDMRAIEIIVERMDGKVPQAIGGDKNNPLVIQVEPILAAKYSKQPVDANTKPERNLPGPKPVPGH